MSEKQSREELAEQLYDQFGRPLETDHAGEYVAISPEGDTVVGMDLLTVSDQALKKFGRGGFIYKVGEVAIGKWR